ncbi:MAG: hypothetical protein AAF635_07175 [Cyanobacteria bacterium P01_C01_bin.69]
MLVRSRFRTLPVGDEGGVRNRAENETAPTDSVFPDSALVDDVWLALTQAMARRRLLQRRPYLRDILNDVPARRLLWQQACAPEGRVALALIVDVMKCSGLIWRGGLVAAQVYDEALSRTWVWFVDKLPTYDPQRASFTTWFNNKLKWMILEESRRALPPPKTTELYGLILPDPYAWENLLNEWIDLVRRDQALMKCRMQGNLRLSCQVLLLAILVAMQEVGEFSWEAIAQHPSMKEERDEGADEAMDPATLKRFCRRRCFARFKELTLE